MNIKVVNQLPIVGVLLRSGEQWLRLDVALLDTGSAATIFPFDLLAIAGIHPPENARLRPMIGIGNGQEVVVEFTVDELYVGELYIPKMIIQAGNTDYGFGFDAIIGFDFLQQVGAVIDLKRGVLYAEA